MCVCELLQRSCFAGPPLTLSASVWREMLLFTCCFPRASKDSCSRRHGDRGRGALAHGQRVMRERQQQQQRSGDEMGREREQHQGKRGGGSKSWNTREGRERSCCSSGTASPSLSLFPRKATREKRLKRSSHSLVSRVCKGLAAHCDRLALTTACTHTHASHSQPAREESRSSASTSRNSGLPFER